MTVEQKQLLLRITRDPEKLAGKAIIRNRRLAVEHVLGFLELGETPETILENYPWLEMDDIRACLLYARLIIGSDEVELNQPLAS